MLVMNPLPESMTQTGEMNTEPGTEHGQYGNRLIIQRVGGFSCSTSTGFWRWCVPCNAWQKGVGIIPAMCCPKCHKLWND